jgi:hypothetical protein
MWRWNPITHVASKRFDTALITTRCFPMGTRRCNGRRLLQWLWLVVLQWQVGKGSTKVVNLHWTCQLSICIAGNFGATIGTGVSKSKSMYVLDEPFSVLHKSYFPANIQPLRHFWWNLWPHCVIDMSDWLEQSSRHIEQTSSLSTKIEKSRKLEKAKYALTYERVPLYKKNENAVVC